MTGVLERPIIAAATASGYKVLVVFGTRPEAIKMVPVIQALRAVPRLAVEVCVTGQHREMLDQVLRLFAITPDYDLDVMRHHGGLTATTAAVLTGLEPVLIKARPDRVLVHGDTASTLAASLAAYYQRIPVGHVEAGLRSGDPYQPWPEEINRRIADVIADQFYAPTEHARRNLLAEGVPDSRIFVTGNTVIDSLFSTLGQIQRDTGLRQSLAQQFAFLSGTRRILLVTGHRRENFGPAFENICHAIRRLVMRHDIEVVYPVHLNPAVQKPVYDLLGGQDRIHLIGTLDYAPFVHLMQRADVILTDSGGIQEEAPSLNKPVFVMRNVTERPEALEAGSIALVGTDPDRIVEAVSQVLDDPQRYAAMINRPNPYGDGQAAQRIAAIIGRSIPQLRTVESVP
jgi:UDP-N-acetylglucosamine 2-epimerase (non-hydrolysing)